MVILLNAISLSVIQIFHTLENIKIIFLVVLLIKLFLLTINSVKKLSCTEERMLLTNLLNQFFSEYNYCRRVLKHFNKNIIMSAKEGERFQLSNIYWICNKLFDVADNKVRDHCNVSGKYRGAAHSSCIVNFKTTKNVPVIFHNLKSYDSHLIFKELSNFNVKVDVIPKGLEKCTAFMINKNLLLIDSMQFMKSSLDLLVKNLMSEDFKYLSKEFSGEYFRFVKEKGFYPYEYMDSFKRLSEDKLPDNCNFFSSLKDSGISEEEYQRANSVCNTFKMNTLEDYHDLYLKTDVLLLADAFEKFIKTCLNYYELDPCHYFGAPGLSWDVMLKMTKIELETISDIDVHLFIEKGMRSVEFTTHNVYILINHLFMFIFY